MKKMLREINNEENVEEITMKKTPQSRLISRGRFDALNRKFKYRIQNFYSRT